VLVLSVPCADPVDLETRFACQICFIDTSICETHELSPREVNPLPPKSKDSFGCSVRWAFVPLDPWHDPARGSQPSHRSANPAAQQQHSLTPLVAQLRASTFDNILTFRPLFLVSFIDASQTCSSSIALLLLTFTSLFIVPPIRLLRPCLLPAACLHHNNSRKQFLYLVFPASTSTPIRDSGTSAPVIHDFETDTITLITSTHNDRSRRGAVVHVAISANCDIELARY
jgi:hypothetical protein